MRLVYEELFKDFWVFLLQQVTIFLLCDTIRLTMCNGIPTYCTLWWSHMLKISRNSMKSL